MKHKILQLLSYLLQPLELSAFANELQQDGDLQVLTLELMSNALGV